MAVALWLCLPVFQVFPSLAAHLPTCLACLIYVCSHHLLLPLSLPLSLCWHFVDLKNVQQPLKNCVQEEEDEVEGRSRVNKMPGSRCHKIVAVVVAVVAGV